MRPSREIQLPAALIRIVLVLILTVRSSVVSILVLLQVAVRIARGLLSGVGVHVSRIRVVVVRVAVRIATVMSLHLCSVSPRVRINPYLCLRY